VSLWRPEAYESFQAAALGELNPLTSDYRRLSNYFSANAVDTELDAAGRVMVPARLLEHGSLSREVVVTGAGDHLQIWDRPSWDTYNEELTGRVHEITEALGNAS
jgi:MraZ protein